MQQKENENPWKKNEEKSFLLQLSMIIIITLFITDIYNIFNKEKLESNNLIINAEKWDNVGQAINIAISDDGKLTKTEYILIKLLHDERKNKGNIY